MSRSYCFTVNNPAGVDINFVDAERVRYAVWQLELGLTGTRHLQGYIELNATVRMNYLRGIEELKDGHFEVRRGTREQARDYCMKSEGRIEGPFEYGEWGTGGPGARNDMAAVYEDLKAGKSVKEVLDKYPSTVMRYIGNIQKVVPLMQPDRNVLPSFIYVYGAPGTGKTSWLRHVYKNAYWHMPGSQWFTGYTGQDVCIFDEYSGNLMINLMNRLTDNTACFVEIKGANVKFTSTLVIICCNRLLDEIYVQNAEKQTAPLDSLKRRLSTSYWFIEPWVYKRYKSYREMEVDILGVDKTISSYESNCRYVQRHLPAFQHHLIEDDVSTEELDSGEVSEFLFE